MNIKKIALCSLLALNSYNFIACNNDQKKNVITEQQISNVVGLCMGTYLYLLPKNPEYMITNIVMDWYTFWLIAYSSKNLLTTTINN